MIAECYLQKADDASNKAHFDNRALVIIYRGTIHRTLLKYPTKITIEHKRYVGMIISGGTIGAFCLLMIWHNLYNPWPVLLGLLTAGLAFYYGWIGSWMLIVHQKNNTLSFPIPGNESNLINFSRFFNQHQKGVKKKMIYHLAEADEWIRQESGSEYRHASLEEEGFIHASEDYQIAGVIERYYPNAENVVILMIDALKLNYPLKYEPSPATGELFPHIYGPLSRNSIIGSLPLKKARDFSIDELLQRLKMLI